MRTHSRLWLGILGLAFALGGHTAPVPADCPASSDTEKMWGSTYPKINAIGGSGIGKEFAIGSRGQVQGISGLIRRLTHFDQRGPFGYRQDTPLAGLPVSASRVLDNQTDGVPRVAWFEFSEARYVSILTDNPAQVPALKALIPPAIYDQTFFGGPMGNGAEDFISAATDPTGVIHLIWARHDSYGTTSSFTLYRIFHATVNPGDASDPANIVPPQHLQTEIAFTSPPYPNGGPVLIYGDYRQAVTCDATGNVHIVWQVISSSGGGFSYTVNYVGKTGGTWGNSEPIDSGLLGFGLSTTLNSNSLAAKSDGTPACVFGKYSNGQNVYAERSTGWALETLSTGLVYTPSLTMDSKNRAIIAGSSFFRRESQGVFSQTTSIGSRPRLLPNDRGWMDGHVRFFYEYNLGGQDAYAMADVGPGALLNTANGNLFYQLPLLQTSGQGMPLGFGLTYNSLETEGDLGLSQNWNHNYQVYLTEAFYHLPELGPQAAELHRQDGSRVRFLFDQPNNAYMPLSQDGDFSRINRGPIPLGNTNFPWVMTDKYGVKYGFGVGNPDAATNHDKLRRIRDLNGNELNLTYGDNPLTAGVAESNLLTVADTVGRQLIFAYNARNQIDHVDLVIQSSIVRTFTFTYETTAARRLTKVKDSAVSGYEWNFEYHKTNDFASRARSGLLSKIMPPKGSLYAWEYGYQTDNRLACVHDPDDSHIGVDYQDPRNGPYLALVTDRRGNRTDYQTDYARSLATKVTFPLTTSDGGVQKFIARTFDPNSRNELTLTDANGNTTVKTYASAVVPTYVKDDLESIQRPGNDLAHRLEFTYTLDGLNRVQTITAERDGPGWAPVVTSMVYDAFGNMLTKTFPGTSSAVEVYTYLLDGRVDTLTDPEGNFTDYDYGGPGDSGTGLVTSITRPASPNPLPETYAYDGRGNQTSMTTMVGGTYSYGFDLRDRMTSSQEPGTPSATLEYDIHDLLEKRTDPKGNITRFTYDFLDRLDEERNALWTGGSLNRIKLTYDPNGNVLTRTDFKDQVTTMAYDARNRLETSTSPTPGTGDAPLIAEYAYDGNSNVLTLTREGGRSPDQVTTMQYDDRNNLTFTIHPAVDDLEAPPTGTLFTVTGAVHVDRTDYDESDLAILGRRSSNGVFKTASATIYNFRNLPEKTRDYRTDPDISGASFIETAYTYDKNTNLLTRTDPDNRTWTYSYDGLNRPGETRDAKNVLVSKTVYNDAANTVEAQIQDPAAPGTLILSMKKQFNPKGELDNTFDFFNEETDYSYDANSNLLSTVDAEGNLVEHEYDALNRLFKTTTHPLPGKSCVTLYVLDENGNRKEIQDPNLQVWKTDFDALNRSIKSTNPSLTFRTLAYDAFGNLRQSIDEGGQTRVLAYDSLNRPTEEAITGGIGGSQTVLYFHDGADRRTKEFASLGMGSASLHRYDALSRQSSQEDMILAGTILKPFRTVSYTYTDAGDRLTATSDDTQIGSWAYEHDEDHLLKKITHTPSNEIHQWTYDQGMRQQTHEMPNGAVETRGYDSKERLQSLVTKTSGGITLSDLDYSFDKVDNRKTLTYNHLGGGGGSFGYDGEYRLVGETWGGGSVPALNVCYHYDENGNRLSKVSGSSSTVYAYDSENRLLTEIGFSASNPVLNPLVNASSTDSGFTTGPITDGLIPDSLLPADAWASQTQAGTQHNVVLDFTTPRVLSRVKLWIPTAQGFVQRFKAQYWDGAAFQDLENPAVIGASPVGTTGWYQATAHAITFDCVVVSTTQARFLQDAGGGPPGTPDQAWLNEMQAFEWGGASTKTLAYNPAGLLTSETSPTGNLAYTYDWGYRLKSFAKPGTTGSYVTDVLGRRLSKSLQIVTGGGGGGGFTLRAISLNLTRYAYDAEDVIGDYNGTPVIHPGGGGGGMLLLARYTNGPGIDQKLTMAKSGGAVHQFVQDGLGSTHQLLNASQNVATQYLFDAWGNELQTTGTVGNRYRYAGRELDPESGNYHYRARFYMPGRGGFGQRDPIRSRMNWRSYVRGNPANRTDPFGLYDLDDFIQDSRDFGYRAFGAAKMAGGLLLVPPSAAAMAAPTGVTQVLGGAGLFLAADLMATGGQEFVHGIPTPTVTNQLIRMGGEAGGLTPADANRVAFAGEFMFTAWTTAGLAAAPTELEIYDFSRVANARTFTKTSALPELPPDYGSRFSPEFAGAPLIQGELKASSLLKNDLSIPLYRLAGGRSPAMGRSWSPIDPRTFPGGIPAFKSAAGIDAWNTGEILLIGRLRSFSNAVGRTSLTPPSGSRALLPEIRLNAPVSRMIDVQEVIVLTPASR